MPISPENLQKLNAAMHQIWLSVARTTTEASGLEIAFGDPIPQVVPMADLYTDMNATRLTITFAFASQPDSQMVILAESEFLSSLYRSFTGAKALIDENTVSELRPIWEAIVQGVCMAVGQLRGEATVATNLAIRYQTLNVPPNLQRQDEVVKVTIGTSCEDYTGSFAWLFDMDMATALIHGSTEAAEAEALQAANGAKGSLPTGPTLQDSAFDMLMDVPLEITVELGRVKMLVKDVLELGSGSIIEIDKAAGEPVDVLVNGRLVARGEVVVIEDNFGVRITEILSTADRLASLSEAA